MAALSSHLESYLSVNMGFVLRLLLLPLCVFCNLHIPLKDIVSRREGTCMKQALPR
jgi:hypothetical protein